MRLSNGKPANGALSLGAMSSVAWEEDPKRLAFTFARYKFVSKMLNGMAAVLEVGCGDSMGSWIVAQHVGRLTAIDKDLELLASAQAMPNVMLDVHDILDKPYPGPFDGAYALDVVEHIDAQHEDAFMRNICASLTEHGTCIIGMPSLESQMYASGRSKRGHVNCKTEEGLRSLMLRHFNAAYIFGMNDETLHTGFGPMCHYRLAIGNSKK
jgi:2-polyprenyl-3-methyl-5-hydroxy-6-metoxy-1,4-benzoquinol methylase